jgi:hypothetical protein
VKTFAERDRLEAQQSTAHVCLSACMVGPVGGGRWLWALMGVDLWLPGVCACGVLEEDLSTGISCPQGIESCSLGFD